MHPKHLMDIPTWQRLAVAHACAHFIISSRPVRAKTLRFFASLSAHVVLQRETHRPDESPAGQRRHCVVTNATRLALMRHVSALSSPA